MIFKGIGGPTGSHMLVSSKHAQCAQCVMLLAPLFVEELQGYYAFTEVKFSANGNQVKW